VILPFVRGLRAAANLIEATGATAAIRDAPDDVEGAYDFITSFAYGEVRPRPIQVRNEFSGLLEILRADPPRRVLEIGTGTGGTLFLLTRVAVANATLVTVDIPGGEFGGGFPRSQTRFLRSFAREQQTISLVRGDSHSPATAAKVKAIVGDVDFLFIDGDHTYDGVSLDWSMYSPLVRAGGLIAFHDIVDGPADRVGGVPRFWSELKSSVPDAREVVEDESQGGYGIGIVRR
jgi:predicted O-methyltransferase YrrM